MNFNFISIGQFGTLNHSLHIANILISNGNKVSYFGVYEGSPERYIDGLNVNEVNIKKKNKYLHSLISRYKLLKLLYLKKNQFKRENTKNILTYFVGCTFFSILIKNATLDIRTFSVHPNKAIRLIKNIILNIECLFFKKVTVLSNEMKEIFYFKNNIHVIPLGGPIFKFKEKSTKILKLLYVGTFKDRDILSTIIAAHKFIKHNPNVSFEYNIIGRGDDREQLKIINYIRKNNLENFIFFRGEISYPHLSQYYESANVGLSYIPITDFYNHQPPTKTYEYLLAGNFVLGTATNANKLLINESNGILINDNKEDILDALNIISTMLNEINFHNIYEASQIYSWESVVKDIFLPVIKR